MPKREREDDEVDFEKLSKVMDFIKSGEFQKIVQDFMSGDSEKYKDLANLRNMFASKVLIGTTTRRRSLHVTLS